VQGDREATVASRSIRKSQELGAADRFLRLPRTSLNML